MSEVAVVVLNYNGRKWLANCLASVLAQTVPTQVIVADNGSGDGSVELVRELFPQVEIIVLGRNLGFAQGYNAALAQVTCPWLALLNNDAWLDPEWLEHLLAIATPERRVAILGGKLLFGSAPDNKRIIQSAGAAFTIAGTAYEIGWGEVDRGQYDKASIVGAVPGAAALIKRQVFLELGGFDKAYFAYLEDVDLCWRAWLAGYETRYVPQALAYHHYGASGGGRWSPFRIRWMQRNRLANMFKNLEFSSLPRGWCVSLAYDAYRTLEWAYRRQWTAWRALASGTAAFLRDLKSILAARDVIQHQRRLTDQALRERGLLAPAQAAYREYRRLGRMDRTLHPA